MPLSRSPSASYPPACCAARCRAVERRKKDTQKDKKMLLAVHIGVLAYAIGNIFTSSIDDMNVRDIVLAIYAATLVVSSLGTNRDSDEERGESVTQCEEETKSESKENEIEKNECKKIDILLARYGTTSRDIDVREKINELVRDDALNIPANLDFNSFFGKDPHRFYRKKLRLVALVNGNAVAHFLSEKRKSDFVLRGDRVESNAASEEDLEEEKEETPSIVSSGNITTPKTQELQSTNLVMTNIHTKFSNLLTQLPTFGNVDTESLMSACDEIASMIGLFGASMLSVRASVTDNLVKIRKQLAMLDVGSDLRVETVIFAERDRGVMKKEGSVCLSMLWLKRSLDFMGMFLDLIRSDKSMSTKDCALNAHRKTLAPWQGWFVRIIECVSYAAQ